MMDRSVWGIFLFVLLISQSQIVFGQGDPIAPSPQEIKDFESIDQPPPPPPETMAEEVQSAPAGKPNAQAPAPNGSEGAPPPPPEIVQDVPAPPTNNEAPTDVPPPPEVASPETPAPVMQADVDDADARREARLARIYKKYNQTEITDEEWMKIAGERAAESYNLQSGDTLWDISTKFFGNGFYWPKVWQLNDEITNPHNIKVDNTLKFSPGSMMNPPRLAVQTPDPDAPEVETMTSAQEVPQSSTQEVTADIDQIVIPKEPVRRSVLMKIPPSFKERGSTVGRYAKNGFAFDTDSRYGNLQHSSRVVSVISDAKWAEIGSVIDMEGEASIAATNQYVFVKINGPAVNGDIFTIYSNGDEIEDPITGKTVGYEVNLKGLIQIVEAISGLQDTHKAIVTMTNSPVTTNDLLKPGNDLVRTSYDTFGPMSPVSARVVDGEMSERHVMRLHDVVYLNQGETSGLQPGQILEVIQNLERRGSKIVPFGSVPIAKLKVVHVGMNVATAVIVQQKSDVIRGDETGMMSQNVSESPSVVPEQTVPAPEEAEEVPEQ